MTYFKSDIHEEETEKLLKKLGKSSIQDDLEYGVLAYIIGATSKVDNIAKAIDDEGMNVDEVYDIIGVFSSKETAMIRFALQCFNSSIDDIKFPDVMNGLDEENISVIKQAIDLRWL